MKKKKWIILLAVLAVIAAGAFIAFRVISSNLGALTDLAINNVDLTGVPDGIYTGTYKVFPVDAEVSVTVRNHSIEDIQLVRHVNGQGGAAAAIPAKVVEAQSLQVDVISGATYSSKVILKAIENALLNAGK